MTRPITRVHVDFDTDVSDFILRMVKETGFSAARCANMLMRNIMSAEVTVTVKTKEEIPLQPLPGREAVRFKKITQIKVQI